MTFINGAQRVGYVASFGLIGPLVSSNHTALLMCVTLDARIHKHICSRLPFLSIHPHFSWFLQTQSDSSQTDSSSLQVARSRRVWHHSRSHAAGLHAGGAALTR